MTAALLIRPMIADDRLSLRQAIIALQDYERLRHTSRLPGAQIADAYLDWMLRQAEAEGAVLLAEIQSAFVGFVAGWIEETDHLAETPDSNRFGYVSDLYVMPAFRGQRIAAQLLDAIEQYLRPAGIVRLRINALAVNRSAWTSYEAAGFVPYEILYEKTIGPGGTT